MKLSKFQLTQFSFTVFSADLLVCGLQGTFIYNLTIDLASRSNPLSHLEQTILGGDSFKYTALFQKLLDLTLEHSNRKLVATGSIDSEDRDVVPKGVRVNKFATGQGEKLFVRGLQATGGLDNLAEMGRVLQ